MSTILGNCGCINNEEKDIILRSLVLNRKTLARDITRQLSISERRNIRREQDRLENIIQEVVNTPLC